MNNKEIYFKAFIENNGKLNEIILGEVIGLNELETREILAQLIAEYKIEYTEYRMCSYSLITTKKRRRIKK